MLAVGALFKANVRELYPSSEALFQDGDIERPTAVSSMDF